jgi:hypothetical protein
MSNAFKHNCETLLFLIDPPIPAEEFRESLWGALVRKPYKPTDGFSSYEKGNPMAMVASLKPQISPINNYEEVINRNYNAEVKAKFQHVLQAFWNREQTHDQSRKATQAQYWHMTNPRTQLRRLWDNKGYQKDVLDFIRDEEIDPKDGLLFVTSMLTLADMEHKEAAAKSTGGGGGLTIPNPQNGSTIAEIGVSVDTGSQRLVAGTFQGSVIVAIGYHEVTFEKVKGAGAWIRNMLGAPSHVMQTVVAIGPNTLYRLNVKDDMLTGGVPFLSKEDHGDGDGNDADNGVHSLADGSGQEEQPQFVMYAPPG